MASLGLMRVKLQEYVLRVNVVLGDDTRRFCEIRVNEDDVYVFQPKKGMNRAKISYHASGQRHLKLGNGPAMFVRYDDRPAWIRSEKDVFAKSLENFSNLLPYKGERADDKFDLEPTTCLAYHAGLHRGKHRAHIRFSRLEAPRRLCGHFSAEGFCRTALAISVENMCTAFPNAASVNFPSTSARKAVPDSE